METWVGEQWHRLIVRAADRPAQGGAAVTLSEMQRSLGMLFRAAGGDAHLRVVSASVGRIGGPRSWLQRVAGTGMEAAQPQLQAEALALPARLAVFPKPEQNRALYLWLAAQGACLEPSGDWLQDNQRASERVLQELPGLAAWHEALLAAHLAQRPDPQGLRPAAAQAERLVQQALRGEPVPRGSGLKPTDVAPVWLWLDATADALAAGLARDEAQAEPDRSRPPGGSPEGPRRRAEAVRDERDKAPLLMFFRAESILSWGEFIKVNRASDDDEDGQGEAVANDMDRLAIAPEGQTLAARVRFDLDLPSAAADDLPLGPGVRLPEWDAKRGVLRPDYCAVQSYVHQPDEAFRPPTGLRATARRVRRRMEMLRAAPARQRGQCEGEEIDLDAWVRYQCEAVGGQRSETPAVYWRRQRSQRSLATLLLADLSLSTDAHVWTSRGGTDEAKSSARVIDVIRDALFVFGEALQASGDPFEMVGFSSVRRQHVRIQHLKGFDEPWGKAAQARVGAIKPGYYTRMGAAIRHATLRLQARPERQRLLLILSDGKPNDLDVYEGYYGLADTRHAVQAARAAGLIPFCITIDEAAHDYLPMLFGQQGYALVHRPQDLVDRLTAVYARFMQQSTR